jgi:biopolymer transport protein ExbD
MSLKNFSDELEQHDDHIDLVPLIDCVFLVLLFYVVCATFDDGKAQSSEKKDMSLSVQLPKAQTAEVRRPKDALVLTISKEGQFQFEDQEVNESALWQLLNDVQNKRSARTLLIKADRNCPYEKIVMAMDMARALKIQEFSFAVE